MSRIILRDNRSVDRTRTWLHEFWNRYALLIVGLPIALVFVVGVTLLFSWAHAGDARTIHLKEPNGHECVIHIDKSDPPHLRYKGACPPHKDK